MQSFAIKTSLSEYSEEEFMAVLNWFWTEDVSEDEENEFVDRFNELVEHPPPRSRSQIIRSK